MPEHTGPQADPPFPVLGVPELRDWKRNPALQREVIEAYVKGNIDEQRFLSMTVRGLGKSFHRRDRPGASRMLRS